ncbi:MAG: hypothetical protein F4029_14375 [Gammaproteobacteria bacterium]|nr:hypothetical protein [Gammaproteobacteria bacterium]MYF29347.1 hypothetical protein [Gammaproteobacteria bacterium]MYK47405.1 hypothetical protein [Gammaproteobacteria bacterium]
MTPGGHVRAAISLGAISLNLLAWSLPLAVLFLTRVLVPAWRSRTACLCAGIYRTAVAFDDWCMQRISGARWQNPGIDLPPGRACIVLANHRSWADILLVQSVISRRGPIVKFLCKRELAYIPVLGMIFLAFDFPVLRRRARRSWSEQRRRDDDRRRVREACATLHRFPAAMLSFAEGTRFTERRHALARSSYRFLLPPRTGGFAAIVEALRPLDAPVVDLTIGYPQPTTLWRFLGGEAGDVAIDAKRCTMREVLEAGPHAWLERTWRDKDAKLDALLAQADQAA